MERMSFPFSSQSFSSSAFVMEIFSFLAMESRAVAMVDLTGRLHLMWVDALRMGFNLGGHSLAMQMMGVNDLRMRSAISPMPPRSESPSISSMTMTSFCNRFIPREMSPFSVEMLRLSDALYSVTL